MKLGMIIIIVVDAKDTKVHGIIVRQCTVVLGTATSLKIFLLSSSYHESLLDF